MTAGENIDETVAFDDYPASGGWSCKYAFRGLSAFEVEADVNPDTTSFDLKYSWAESEKLEPGIYAYSGFVLSGDTRTKVDSGTIEILANPSKKSNAQIMLEGIRAVMTGRATADQLTISFADVQLQYMTPEELKKRWKAKIALASGRLNDSPVRFGD